MEKLIKVNFRGIETKEFPKGTKLVEVAKSFEQYFNYPILIARVDNEMVELSDELHKRCKIDFYDRSMGPGNSIYARSLQFLLVAAVKRLFGSEVEVVIEHSIDKGFYCEILGVDIDKAKIKELTNTMDEISKEGLIYTKLSVSRLEAIKFFNKKKQYDKGKVLKYISNTYINLYRLGELYDYYYGPLAYSTDTINEYKLTYIKDNGFVVNYPDIYNPEITKDYHHYEMLFDAFLEYTKWGRILNINNAADLNELISKGKSEELIRISEAYYNRQLAYIADQIHEKHKDIKVILIAGPSSSGKTTTSKKLQTYLATKGLITHPISTDDYFICRKKTPLDKDGNPDFESIKAVDVELFNQQMLKLIAGEKVLLPEYNFLTGEREYKNKYVELKENDLIIVEGIHALNEDLTTTIDKKHKLKIYIAPLTQLNIDNHNRIHTSDTRKLRRIIRDNKHRGYNATDTLNSWKKVREGEEIWIYPFQDSADYIINSSLIYELGVLKTYVEPLLFSVLETDEQYPEAIRLINFLRNFLPIPSDAVPTDSVLREFIGGSCFYE